MKTIFISSFHGYVSRNILATDAFSLLVRRDDLRLVIFIPQGKREFFEKNFGRNNVFIEEVPFGPPSNTSLGALIAKRIAKFGLNSASTRIERRIKWKCEGRFFYFLAASLLANMLCRSAVLRRVIRLLDYRLGSQGRYQSYFERYSPDLVVITDIQNERDVELLQNAKLFGVRNIGMVRSWDNLTLHGMLRILPDKLLVGSSRARELAIALNDMPARHIEIIGIPHYDKYFRGPRVSKEEFFIKCGFPQNKKTLFWTPVSDYYIPDNDVDPFVFRMLGERNEQVIARFSPSLEVKTLEDAKPYSNMIIDRPGLRFANGGLELSSEDDDRLMHSIYFSDMVICGPSTIALDAVFMDKPVVLVGFHPKPRNYLTSVSRRYDYDHFQFLLECGAADLAKSKEELPRLIEENLKNPWRNAEGRELLRQAYGGPRDGKSGKRFVETILKAVCEA